jgi:hypothetical protein
MNPLTINEQRLVLETKIAERALIIYVNESALADESDTWSSGYERAIVDEIKNHKTILGEYQEELKQLQK